MSSYLLADPYVWGGERDEEGHRTWSIGHTVGVTANTDGPAIVMQTSGLPLPGSYWSFGSDIDVWAFCLPFMKVSPLPEYKRGEWIEFWNVEQKFTTKPQKRCNTTTIEDPLAEPAKISGSFVKYTKEAIIDRFGRKIRSSSHEPYHGPAVEFDHNRPTVKIEQNVSSLGLATFSRMIDRVNDSTLWGCAARCVKLSNASWERKLHGTCSYYYTRAFEFDIDFNTFDKRILDEGNKVLNGHWDKTTGNWTLDNIAGAAPDPDNPNHFIRAIDRAGNPMRMLLNGAGKPLDIATQGTGEAATTGTDSSDDVVSFKIEFYEETNMLALGIPSSL